MSKTWKLLNIMKLTFVFGVLFMGYTCLLASAQSSTQAPPQSSPKRDLSAKEQGMDLSAQKTNTVFPLSPLSTPKTDATKGISCFMSVQSAQHINAKGIRIALIINNNTGNQIQINNPLDSLDVMLTNSQGWPLDLPPSSPRFRAKVAGSESTKFHLSFAVEKVSIAEKELSQKEIESLSFKLPQNTSCDILLKVQFILQLHDQAIPPTSHTSPDGTHARVSLEGSLKHKQENLPTVVDIPHGNYMVRIGFGLSMIDKNDNSVFFKSELAEVQYLLPGETPLLAPMLEKDGIPIHVGQPAPEFIVVDIYGKSWSLSDFRGKKNLLLTFFPKCFTGDCANHLSSLRDHQSEFDDLNTQIIAVSVDPAEGEKGQLAFAKQWRLTFPLIPDTNRTLCKLYGAVTTYQNLASRQSVLIDKNGIIRFIDRKVNVRSHGADMLSQMSDLGLGK